MSTIWQVELGERAEHHHVSMRFRKLRTEELLELVLQTFGSASRPSSLSKSWVRVEDALRAMCCHDHDGFWRNPAAPAAVGEPPSSITWTIG